MSGYTVNEQVIGIENIIKQCWYLKTNISNIRLIPIDHCIEVSAFFSLSAFCSPYDGLNPHDKLLRQRGLVSHTRFYQKYDTYC